MFWIDFCWKSNRKVAWLLIMTGCMKFLLSWGCWFLYVISIMSIGVNFERHLKFFFQLHVWHKLYREIYNLYLWCETYWCWWRFVAISSYDLIMKVDIILSQIFFVIITWGNANMKSTQRMDYRGKGKIMRIIEPW